MPSDTPQPCFVLVRPQMGENIGAAARAMWNFGLDRMRVVAPRDGWPNEKA
ncbi:MAG: RNA methyltransferase, partial [Pseudomonadota bacterium]|nr:RNA methyltransferase [Pseudomonadota bacterium]